MEKRMQHVDAGECRLREIGSAEVPLIEPLIAELAQYHDGISRHFGDERGDAFVAERIRECVDDLEDGKAHVLVAEVPGVVVGFCKYDIVGDTAYIDELAVAEGFRGRGVGSCLMDEAERAIREAGAKTCELRVVVGNDSARRFYERRGFLPSVLEMKRML